MSEPVRAPRERMLRVRTKRTLLSIYGTWHRCMLRRGERGLRKGRLCDVCLECIEADLATIFAEATR